jgi:MFS family permease
MGCVIFIPLAKKFGRRPVYLVSTALMLVTSFWISKLESLAELYIANLLQGLAGATNESIVQITVCFPLVECFGAHASRSPISSSYIIAGE